jgi:hypothetical protein
MSKLNGYGYGTDGNVIGRVGAVLLLAAAGFGLHRLNCGDGMCPLMKTESCCAGAAATKAETPKPAAVPSVPAK